MSKFYKTIYLQIGVFCYHFLLTTSTLSTLGMIFGSFYFTLKYILGVSYLTLKWWIILGCFLLVILIKVVKFIINYENNYKININKGC